MVKSKVAVIAMILVVVIVLVTGQTTPSVDTFACKRSKVKEVFYVMFFCDGLIRMNMILTWESTLG